MSVARLAPVLVIDDDGIAISALDTGKRNPAIGGGLDVAPVGRIEECLRTVSQTRDLVTIRSAVDVCAEACSKALARLDRQLVDQKKELATLLNMVQDALAIVAGDSVHGHVLGNRALTVIARTLKTGIRQNRDVVARIGGDEFALLISDLLKPDTTPSAGVD